MSNNASYDASFFFKADKKRVLATVRVQEDVGGNIDEAVKSFCASEGIPPETQLYLRAAAWALETECNERGPMLRDAFEELEGTFVQVESNSKKLWKEKALAPRVSSPQDSIFSNAYRLSVNDKTLLENMIYMEHMYSKALYELVQARDSTDNNDHLQEYEKEIFQVINEQRKGYQEFVVAQAAEIAESDNNTDSLGKMQTLLSNRSFPLENNVQEKKAGFTPRRVWKNRGAFLGRFEEVDVMKRGLHKLYIGDYKGKAIVRGRRNMRGKNNSSDASATTQEIQICLGRQHKMSYDVVLENLLDKSLQDMLIFPVHDEKESLRLRKSHAVQLYSNNKLRALVVPIEASGSLNNDILYACNATTEMHFERIEEQFQYALKKYFGSEVKGGSEINSNLPASQPTPGTLPVSRNSQNVAYFNAGEVLVTRHSNLNNVHVIFHIVPFDMEIKYDENADKYSLSEKIENSTGSISVAGDQSGGHSDKLRGIDHDNIRKSLEKIIAQSNMGGIRRLYVAHDLFLSYQFERTMRSVRTSLLHVVGEFGDRRMDLRSIFFLHIHKAEPTNKGTSKTNIHNAMEKRMKNFFQHDM
eukprot:g2673.t1